MAEDYRGRDRRNQAGSGKHQWRDNGDRSWRGEDRGGRRFDRDDRGFRRDDRDGRRSFSRDDRGERGFGRDDRGFRRNDRDDRRSFNRNDRDDRGFRRNDRDDRGFRRNDRDDRGFRRNDRDDRGFRRNDRDDRRSFNRNDRDDRRSFNRNDRDDRRSFNRNDRDDRRSFNRNDRDDRGFRRNDRGDRKPERTNEFAEQHADEPMIPAGVSADELDGQILKTLSTLSGANRDIVARHLVMAGQLLDLDPEQAYAHAQAAARRAGRVDVVREATALTAYATGRYEEALREVRAVRRMRGDNSLRAVEADCERGLGRPDKAVELIDATSTAGMDLDEQVELVLVSSGARADLGQYELGLIIVDDALAQMPADADPELLRRLMSVKADRLRDLGRTEEADDVEAAMPAEIDDPDIVDVSLVADADVDSMRSLLRGSETSLSTTYDCVLLDLDGTARQGSQPIPHAAEEVLAARDAGMATAFVTNNAMRTPEWVAEQMSGLGFEAEPGMVMTSSMDVLALMAEHLEPGAKVLVIGGDGLRGPVEGAGYVIVDSADDEPAAVVQGLDKSINWAMMSEAAFAIERGAKFFATNLDATLPSERGFALGNGALVRAVRHATGVRPMAAGKPEPGIYQRGAELVGGTNPLVVGDRLETDILGAVAAGIASMHVLTGVHKARDIILAPKGQRPTYVAIDMRGLNESHPRPKHHRDGTWTCGFSQVARAQRDGSLTLDDIALTDGMTISLDSYRALIAAAWERADNGLPVTCPNLTVVQNDDPAGIVTAPVEVAEVNQENAMTEDNLAATPAPDGAPTSAPVVPEESEEADLAALNVDDGTPTFLPGEEELEALLADTEDLDVDAPAADYPTSDPTGLWDATDEVADDSEDAD